MLQSENTVVGRGLFQILSFFSYVRFFMFFFVLLTQLQAGPGSGFAFDFCDLVVFCFVFLSSGVGLLLLQFMYITPKMTDPRTPFFDPSYAWTPFDPL